LTSCRRTSPRNCIACAPSLVGSKLSADERAAYLAALGEAVEGLRAAWFVLAKAARRMEGEAKG
jgi:hypothetical protein